MDAKRFTAGDMRRALQLVREHLGPDAVILSSKKNLDGVEVVATTDYHVEDMEEQHAREIAPVASKIYRQLTGVSEKVTEKLVPSVYQSASQSVTPSIVSTVSPILSPVLEHPAQVELSAMRSEMDQLRQLLTSLSVPTTPVATAPPVMPAPLVPTAPPVYPGSYYGGNYNSGSYYGNGFMNPVQVEIKRRLELLGLPLAWHESVLRLLSANPATQVSVKQAWRLVLSHLQRRMTVAKTDWVDAGGIFALVGPTGAGKTTTIAKLAARYAMRYGAEQVGLISLDTQRVGGTQHLKAMGKMLGIQVRAVETPNELDVALRILRGCSLVLIDTAGVRPGSVEQQHLLKCLQVDSRIKTLLTLPATSQYPVLKTQWHCYRQVARGLIATKLDEAMSLGEIMAVAIDSRLPLVYTTDGQRIPENIALPDISVFIKQVVEKVKVMHSIRQEYPLTFETPESGVFAPIILRTPVENSSRNRQYAVI